MIYELGYEEMKRLLENPESLNKVIDYAYEMLK
jgi:hypothetical protein